MKKQRPMALVMVLASAMPSTVAAAADNYEPMDAVVESLAARPTLCLLLEEDGDCLMAGHITAITRERADVVLIGLVNAPDASGEIQSLKFAISQRWDFSDAGACWTVPKIEELKFSYYRAGNTIGDITTADQFIPLSAEQRNHVTQSMAPMFGTAGDTMCDQHRPYEVSGGKVTAYELISFLNGSQMLGEGTNIMHLFEAGRELSLAPLL